MDYRHLNPPSHPNTIHFSSRASVSNMPFSSSLFRKVAAKTYFVCLAAALLNSLCSAQDWVRTGTGLGVEKIRLAASDFKPSTQDSITASLIKTFNDTLWSDLDNAGIFDMVSKSFYPLGQIGAPSDVKFEVWNSPPPNAAMLVFGNVGASANT